MGSLNFGTSSHQQVSDSTNKAQNFTLWHFDTSGAREIRDGFFS